MLDEGDSLILLKNTIDGLKEGDNTVNVHGFDKLQCFGQKGNHFSIESDNGVHQLVHVFTFRG